MPEMFTLAIVLLLNDQLGTIRYRAAIDTDYARMKLTAYDTASADTLEFKYSLLGLYQDKHTWQLNDEQKPTTNLYKSVDDFPE